MNLGMALFLNLQVEATSRAVANNSVCKIAHLNVGNTLGKHYTRIWFYYKLDSRFVG